MVLSFEETMRNQFFRVMEKSGIGPTIAREGSKVDFVSRRDHCLRRTDGGSNARIFNIEYYYAWIKFKQSKLLIDH